MAVRASLAVAAASIAAVPAFGAMSYLTQTRTIAVSTTADGAVDSLSAPDFNPFIETLSLSTQFPASGGAATNRAVAGIDCHLDPNKIKVVGRLAAAGGVNATDGQEEVGDAMVMVSLTFHLDADSEFFLAASARPDANPKDKFKIKLSGPGGGGNVIFLLDEKGPAQAVRFGGVLVAGDYKVEYEAEVSSAGTDADSPYSFTLDIPAPGSSLVLGAWLLGAARRRR